MTADHRPDLMEILANHHEGVLATLKRNGRPQLSVVSYTYDPATRLIRASITDGRAKTANLRRDPRASFQVTNKAGFGYAVAEGKAELTPPAKDPADDTVTELIDVYRVIVGEHPDWDDYRAAMVADRRIVLRIPVDYVYGITAAG
ncbi:MAG: TIGR03618 family F420-dependent PPOX class oxidoreductase [Streptosporangiales bacterium]|nr:TIGR03618 family F420-dependent PPOX class oxidoreductase [Streptosporangiales bacterium]